MTITKEILEFSANHKTLTLKELMRFFEEREVSVLSKTVSQQLGRFVKAGRLLRLERGVYAFPETAKRSFTFTVSDELKQLNENLKTQFPFAKYCIWNSDVFLPFMHHIPNLNYIYVDVESDATESAFNHLKNNQLRRVYFRPDKETFNRYIAGTEAIIVRQLVSESPLQVIENFNVPTLEKILVDIVGDVEFEFLQDVESVYFYENVMEQHELNRSKLFRYASRRGRRQEVEQLYNEAL
jgi:predicted transcriptional regulator of viral defense system